jgi:hypothetical protein
MAVEDELERVKRAVQMLSEMYVHSVGRIAALEIIAAKAVFDRAALHDDPFEWVQGYVRLMQADLDAAVPASPDQRQFEQATQTAIEEFLEQMLMKAGSLPGAPSNRPN